jgi:hypothetical protein
MCLSDNAYEHCFNLLINFEMFQEAPKIKKWLEGHEKLAVYRYGVTRADTDREFLVGLLAYLCGKHLDDGTPLLVAVLERYARAPGEPGKAGQDLQNLIVVVKQELRPRPTTTPGGSPGQLRDSLCNLNFDDQLKTVAQAMKARPTAAAFLVHGPPSCGQEMLVSRLLREQPRWADAHRVILDFGARGLGYDVDRVWEALRARLKLPTAAPADLLNCVCQWLAAKDVLFVLHTVDFVPPKVLADWMEAFWKQLVDKVAKVKPTDRNLVLVLVDYRGSAVSDHSRWLVNDYGLADYPVRPLALPPNGPFPVAVLDAWVTNYGHLLPNGVTAGELFQESKNGYPDKFYRGVYRRFDPNNQELLTWRE